MIDYLVIFHQHYAMNKHIQIHVSASASKKADGSAAHPYPSLEAARDALRKLKRRAKLKAPVRVLVAPGVYRLNQPFVLTPEDSGTAQCPITWAGNGGRPLLSGARIISNWKDGTINGLPCWQTTLSDVAAGRWWFTQLFVNGHRRLRARFPKQGFFRFTGVSDEEAKLDKGGFFHGAMSSHFKPGDVRAFKNPGDIDVVVPDHWYENHLRVASIDEKSHTIHFATKGYSRFSRDETGRHTRFRLDHVAEACTDPGDWYLNRKTGTLSYIPMPGETQATTLVEAPKLERLLDVQGDAINPKRRVQHVRFEFLDFRHADWELPRDNSGALQSAYQVPAAVRFVGADDCALYGCRVSQVGGWAVEVLRGCHRNRIVACALHDLGGGGVKIGHSGGLPKGWVDGSHGAFRSMDAAALGWGPCREDKGGQLAGRDQVEPSATTVSDCSIHDGGLIFHSAIGVWVGDAAKNRIVHNQIWNFSYSGISCGWTWGFAPAFTYDNRIECNRIHSIGHGVLSDMGAIYTLGRQAGTTINRNYISNVHSYGYGGWGIYPDEGSSWMKIEDNVVCGTKCGGFHQHYGRDNSVRRNVFVDTIENQVQVSRKEFVRSVIFENNLVQGAGNGSLWKGAGWASAKVDHNVYAGDPGRPALFVDQNWDAWQKAGHDLKGCFIEAILLDAGGASIATANPAALRAAGIDPKQVAQVVAEAGPRIRSVMPPTIDDVPREPEVRRAIVEPLFWPWPSEWPIAGNNAHPWSQLPGTTAVTPDEPFAISLTLENRGDAPARGRYRLCVIPANAARLKGLKELAVTLKPGGRVALDTSVIATGKAKNFSVEAVAEGLGLVTSCLHFYSLAVKPLTADRLPATPALKILAPALASLQPHPLRGNASPVKANLRVAIAGPRLLLQAEVADSNPTRAKNLWEGSCIELFVAPKTGMAPLQLIVAPAIGKKPATALLATPKGMGEATGIELTSAKTASGWSIAFSVPLTLIGIEPAATSMVIDVAANATRKGKTKIERAFLASEFNPWGNSTYYLRVNLPAKSN